MEIKKEIQELFDRANALTGEQVLYTTFGPENYYVIRKHKKFFTLTEYRNKYSFQKEGKEISSAIFKTANELNMAIFSHTGLTWYARNVFSGNLIHLDNWVNFVKAFKLKRLEYTDNGSVTQDWYHYVNI